MIPNPYITIRLLLALALCGVGQVAFAQDAHYVATNSTPANPYTNWTDAANDIQSAIDVSTAGDTVWVSNGVYETGGTVVTGYSLTNRIAITTAITVRSANNDPPNTIIVGASDNGVRGNAAVRCAYMTNAASLIGFTLTNGYTMTNGIAVNDQCGGGIFMHLGGIVSNCIIVGNVSSNGGGAYLKNGGTLDNCTIAGNVASNITQGMGGGVAVISVGYINNCLISNNATRTFGGGLNVGNGSVVSNCTITLNRGTTAGGGISMSQGSTVKKCLITKNYAGGSGGGGIFCIGGSVYNSALLQNSCGANGGGTRLNSGGNFFNCTISGNRAASEGGALFSSLGVGTFENCILWGNTAGTANSNVTISSAVTISNSCSGPVWTGTNGLLVDAGNIGSDPMFVDTNTANHRLSANSPCIDTGTNGIWTTNAIDLDGNVRIYPTGGKVDMGTYEWFPMQAYYLWKKP